MITAYRNNKYITRNTSHFKVIDSTLNTSQETYVEDEEPDTTPPSVDEPDTTPPSVEGEDEPDTTHLRLLKVKTKLHEV